MSSSIINEFDAWHVSNMMFWRVMDFGQDVAKEYASTPIENASLASVSERLKEAGTYSPDFTVEELFGEPVEIRFWSEVFRFVADGIYRRTIGNQQDQNWQVSTIWAAFGLARLLESTASQIEARTRRPMDQGRSIE